MIFTFFSDHSGKHREVGLFEAQAYHKEDSKKKFLNTLAMWTYSL